MKHVFLILAALLAVNVLAVVPFYEQGDAELPRGAYWEDNTLVMQSRYDSEDEEEEVENHLEHVLEERSVAGGVSEVANTTGTSHDKRDQGMVAVDVRISNDDWSHIGTRRKYRMWHAVYNCLKVIAEQGHGKNQDATSKDFPMTCKPGKNADKYCQFQCRIQPIVYEAGPNKYATNAYIQLETEWSELREDNHPGIRDLAYKFLSDIFRLFTDDAHNCYDVDFTNSRRSTLCNVPTHILMVWPARGTSPVQARLNFKMTFNGKTTSTRYHCINTLPRISQHFHDNVKSNMASVMGWHVDKIDYYNSCQPKACFDTSYGYDNYQHWVEPKGCQIEAGPVVWK
ncbi:hypothetical protein ACEQ8H_002164 [Pleosporales sp. CAS-2024a]